MWGNAVEVRVRSDSFLWAERLMMEGGEGKWDDVNTSLSGAANLVVHYQGRTPNSLRSAVHSSTASYAVVRIDQCIIVRQSPKKKVGWEIELDT